MLIYLFFGKFILFDLLFGCRAASADYYMMKATNGATDGADGTLAFSVVNSFISFRFSYSRFSLITASLVL